MTGFISVALILILQSAGPAWGVDHGRGLEEPGSHSVCWASMTSDTAVDTRNYGRVMDVPPRLRPTRVTARGTRKLIRMVDPGTTVSLDASGGGTIPGAGRDRRWG